MPAEGDAIPLSAAAEASDGAFFLFWNMAPILGAPVVCGMIPAPAAQRLESTSGPPQPSAREGRGAIPSSPPPSPSLFFVSPLIR